ncbi:ABC transporter substrate-binding protein [Microbacterium sp. KRD172]|uniref:ABC transporter substrate-binding protein n=1 Tax=Microbacterium sp. KRD172 TaxID=2729727 RepID=UPI0019D2F144|nr:extracellular solute-binding protein [Microbacterium sp. KRD172]
MNTNHMKRFGTVAGIAAAALVLSACGGTPAGAPAGAGDSSEEGGSKTLTVAIQAWMSDKLAVQAMADQFEAEHEGYTVELVEYADNQALSTFALQWSQGQSDQDIVITDGASTAVQFVEQDLIVDFNETGIFEGDLAESEFIGEALTFTELDGNQFAMPFGLEAYNISANKLILEQAGLLGTDGALPEFKTWDDVYDAAAAITAATGQPGMTIQWGPNAVPTMFAVEQALRGDIYAKDGTTLTFDTAEMREVLGVWRKGVEAGVFTVDTFSNKDAGRSNFNAGSLGMLLETASRVPEAGQTLGMENVALLAMPGSLENGSFAFSAGVIIPTASENQELALEFISTAMMSDLQVQAGEEWGKLPVLKRYFEQIDAEWKDEMYSFVELSVPAPMYNDLPMIQERGKQLLQEFLTGSIDEDQFIASFEDLIATSDLGN